MSKPVVLGGHLKWELNTMKLSQSNKDNPLRLPKFFIKIENQKVDCNVQFYTFYQINSYNINFYLHLNVSTYSRIFHLLTVASFRNSADELIHQNYVKIIQITSIGNKAHNITDTIKLDEIKSLKYKYNKIFLHLSILDITVDDTDFSKLNLNESSANINLTKINDSYDHCCEISKDFNFSKSSFLTNTVFVLKNGEINVHINILSARCPYFAAAFKNNNSEEKRSGRILMKRQDGHLFQDEIVKIFIEYIYTGVAHKLDQYSLDLYEIADMYNIQNLQEQCIMHIKANINIDNAMIILIFAKKYNIADLHSEISAFLKAHSKIVRKSISTSIPTDSSTLVYHRPTSSVVIAVRRNCEIIMEEICVMDQSGQIFKYGVRYLLLLDTSLLHSDPYEIRSHELHVKNKLNENYHLRFIIFQNTAKHCYFKIDFITGNPDSFVSKIYLALGTSETFHYLHNINKTLNLLPEWSLKVLVFDSDKIFLTIIIRDCFIVTKDVTVMNSGETSPSSINKQHASHNCQFAKDVASLYNQEHFSDFKILSKDKEFSVHKSILAARSSVFATKFRNDKADKLSDCEQMVIDAESKVVEGMLQHIYCHKIENFNEIVTDLCMIGKKYNLQNLQNECVLYINENLSVDNLIDVLKFAQMQDIVALKVSVAKFFEQHLDEVLNSDVNSDFVKSLLSLKISLKE